MTTINQRLVVTEIDGNEAFRRARPTDEDVAVQLTYAQVSGGRASVNDPGVTVTLRGDGYYIVSEWLAGASETTRVIARGHLNLGGFDDTQRHHIAAGQCPAPTVVGGVDREIHRHCGERIDEFADCAPYCAAHKGLR